MEIKLSAKLAKNRSAEDIFQTILKSRGHKTRGDQQEFLSPPEPSLDYLLKNSGIKLSSLKSAQKIIDFHLNAGHDICVFGDYDADGVTATALMWQALSAYAKKQKSGSRILPFIPDRHKHGYGLSDKAVDEIITGLAFVDTQFDNFLPKLVVTVDTGIVAKEGIKTFINQSIEVIVTDHHQLEKSLPPATSIVHTTLTSGAGIAWIVSMYLLGDIAKNLLDLATIGIVADLMPVTGLNRAIITSGLKIIEKSTRPGIIALRELIGSKEKSISTYLISFAIAPRINAAGRIYSPLDALRLLCTSDKVQANELAKKIELQNKDRQDLTDQALKIVLSIKPKHKIIVVIGDYHEGVIGLVAGKLVEKFNLPAVVMSDNKDIVKGSARSLPGIDITKMLRSLPTHFLGLGGHEQAAGFSLEKTQVKNMTSELVKLANHSINSSLLVKTHAADLELSLSDTTLALAKKIRTLEPFGIGNPKPKFLLNSLKVVEDRKLGAEGKHRRLTVEQDGVTRELMHFNSVEPHPLINISSAIVTLDINLWRSKESLQLIGSYVKT